MSAKMYMMAAFQRCSGDISLNVARWIPFVAESTLWVAVAMKTHEASIGKVTTKSVCL